VIDTARSTAKTAAYGDLVAGLLDVRDDVATERFDAEVAAAVASGRLDPDIARRLRWLQRESVRGLVEHARTALPAAMLGLDQARADQARDDDSTLDDDAFDDVSLDESDDMPADHPPRRLLVAGLTVLPNDP